VRGAGPFLGAVAVLAEGHGLLDSEDRSHFVRGRNNRTGRRLRVTSINWRRP